MKVVINKCHGGYGLSYAAVMEYARLKGIKLYAYINKEGDICTHVPYEERGNQHFICVHYCTKKLKNEKDEKTLNDNYFWERDIKRDDPILIKVIESLGEEASSGQLSKLKIVEIPDGTKYEIEEYDGMEHIAEKHRTWG